MSEFVQTANGVWHYEWCTYVLPDAEPRATREEPPAGGWPGDTCDYCMDDVGE